MSQGNAEFSWKKSGFGVAVSVFVGVLVFNINSVPHWWTSIISAIESVWVWITEPVSISRIYLGFLGACSICLLYLLSKRLFEPRNSYREDLIFNLLWRWKWENESPYDLKVHCPVCTREMHNQENSPYDLPREVYFSCQGCQHRVNQKAGFSVVKDHVDIEIKHRWETGLWKKAISRSKG